MGNNLPSFIKCHNFLREHVFSLKPFLWPISKILSPTTVEKQWFRVGLYEELLGVTLDLFKFIQMC